MGKKLNYNPETAIVQTTRGKIRGYEQDGLYMFKGVPYAQAKRFHAPEPVEAWEGVLETTNYGFVCPLLKLGKPNGEVNCPHRYWPMDEACQNLNLWTPGLDDKKRPVLVWLHGGGFAEGSAIEQLAYEGEHMSRLGDVVVVSVNHRLNILGYFDLSAFGEEYRNSGNAGGDDIIAVLQWLHDNVDAFGGDPDNVTVFGQSGGGAKVTTLLQSPAADGLYHKGIVMSGVVPNLLPDGKGRTRELADAVMEELGIDDVKQLETVDYHDLAKAYGKVSPALSKAGKYTGCMPLKNEFYLGEPVQNGFRKETANIPLLVGSVFGEFTGGVKPEDKSKLTEADAGERIEDLFGEKGADALIPLFKKAHPTRSIVDLLSMDFLFREPQMEYVKVRSALNDCTWAYLFDQDMPVNYGSVPWHCSDIAFVFHNVDMMPYVSDDADMDALEDQIFSTVMAFARTGDPNNSKIPNWPASTTETENTMKFSKNTALTPDHDKQLMPVYVKYMAPIFFKRLDEIFSKAQH